VETLEKVQKKAEKIVREGGCKREDEIKFRKWRDDRTRRMVGRIMKRYKVKVVKGKGTTIWTHW